ncbi:MAG: hypothetical protein IJX67_10350 [Oscillospiraceae bacterium]|nr:hypothetical protein [Oscillospiraceae bacterium]
MRPEKGRILVRFPGVPKDAQPRKESKKGAAGDQTAWETDKLQRSAGCRRRMNGGTPIKL